MWIWSARTLASCSRWLPASASCFVSNRAVMVRVMEDIPLLGLALEHDEFGPPVLGASARCGVGRHRVGLPSRGRIDPARVDAAFDHGGLDGVGPVYPELLVGL